MALQYVLRITEHLSHPNYQPSTFPELVENIGVPNDDRDLFGETLDRLVAENKIERGEDARFRLPTFPDEVVGNFRRHPRGFGFLKTDEPYRHGDLFIPAKATGGALRGDRVRARVIHTGWRGRKASGRSPYSGEVIEILERNHRNLTGVLKKRGKNWIVEPDGREWAEPIVIRDPHAKNAKQGDKVAIELLHYPEGDERGEGVITQVLGDAGKPDVETQAVIIAHGLRTEFPDEALDEARDAAKHFDEDAPVPEDREDLTKDFIFTIDPPDAKDFDDAISLTYDAEREEFTLGVHIADVSHFVTPGSALDKEASARGNSVYLPRLVIPMLPEVLSNGVCSLQEGVLRFTKSAFISFDRRGKVIGQRLAATAIKSRKRLTYLEAQALIDGDQKEARKHARTEPEYSDELIETLRRADDLAKRLRKRRIRDGMVVLNLPEVELKFDDHGHVIDAEPEDDAFTHTIIEMFMVEANEALARTFAGLHIPILRRIHPDPVHGDIEELNIYARAVGLGLPESPDRKDIQRLLEATHDTPAARAIHFAVLRTLSKASYSPALIGHFALASDHYAHFTSPIRRYPDLTLHRAMLAFLDHTDNGRNVPGGRKRDQLAKRIGGDSRVPDEEMLIGLGRHCSETEEEAAAAERELRSFLVMQLLHEQHLGEEFAGVVTGVTRAGAFVSIERFLVEGLVGVDDLPNAKSDRWVLNEDIGRIVASRSGASLMLGDFVTVQVVAVDLAARQLDLLITRLPERDPVDPGAGRGRTRGRKSDAKRKRQDRAGKRGKGKGQGKGKGKRKSKGGRGR